MNKNKRLNCVFYNMKQRCYNKKHKSYHNYGGRGITICDEWLNDSQKFYNWALENGWNEDNLYKSGRNKLTIDRIDNNGNYEPSNCRIITLKENQYNRNNNVYINYKGEKYTLEELSKKLNIPLVTIRSRYLRKIDFDTKYIKQKEHYFEINGTIKSLTQLAKENNMTRKFLYHRVFEMNWSIEEAINLPKLKAKRNTKMYDYNGEKYNLTDLARKLNIPITTLGNRIRRNANYDGTKKENTK